MLECLRHSQKFVCSIPTSAALLCKIYYSHIIRYISVLLLWCQIMLLWHQITMVASEQHLYQTVVLPRKHLTGSIHDYLFCYCPLLGILFQILRIALYILSMINHQHSYTLKQAQAISACMYSLFYYTV